MPLKTDAVQIGQSNTATNNFVLSTANDGTAKLARGNSGATSQDILTVDAAGKVAFPNNPAIPTAVQTWQDVSGSRTSGTTYTNSTGQPITISYGCVISAGLYSIVVAGVNVSNNMASGGVFTPTFVVPSGATYVITETTLARGYWKELR